ncbi:BRCA1-associated ATM activator 1-like [Salarias fasciatus]|uniref:BRCA1-associated ATM activator 1-like n=1 Tax=Salarias fasciatus TaxID=181472 RepID=UPI00117670BD|nr:BRCA1-associated ATM activator 1-like [Salarias fasciatus]
MDRECSSLLPQVCELLAASGCSLPDDTSLEKLLDWFTALTKAGESLLETCPYLLEFISTVIHNTAADPSILSFTIRLAGLIAATEDGFQALQESSVLDLIGNVQHWQEAGLWEDPCIRIGWVQGFRAMLQHPKALGFFSQAGSIEPLLQLQTDSSLFVVSAANQMLLHVLLLCQNVSSVECKVKHKKEVDNEGTQSSISDLERLAVTVEKSQDLSDVVAKILEYLKKSLVPKETIQLHQTLQSLKLLALLLDRVRPPLRGTLLHTVSDSLEELVAADHSQLTVPLMDVIVAAYSSGSEERLPDQRVGHLLSFMLSIKKPADLLHAAAAFLHRGHHDRVHTAQCVRVLLLPLQIMTGHTLLDTNAAVPEHRRSVAEQLKSKTSCISIICVCLSNTPQITLMDPECVPCPPPVIVAAVVSSLRLCSGDSSSSPAGCSEAFRNIVGNKKVQKCGLEALIGLTNCPGVKVKLNEVITLLVQYLENPDSEPTVLHKSYQTLVKWMTVCTDVSSITEQHRNDLLRVVTKRVCDMRWEVRDSTLEFLGHLAGVQVGQTCSASEALLGGSSCTIPLLREALHDPESYVRASAVCALAQTLTRSWQQGAALTEEQTEIVGRLLEILSEDTEGFSRRAVVRYFIVWYSSHSPSSSPSSSSSSLLMRSVRSVLSRGSADLDWEVKVHTLQLAELLLAKAFSGRWGQTGSLAVPPAPYAVTFGLARTPYTHSGTHTEGAESDLVNALNTAVDQGIITALLSSLVDCDRPVGVKACQLLIALRDAVCLSPQGEVKAAAAVEDVTFELSGRGWAREIRKLLAVKNQAEEADATAPRGLNGVDGTDPAAEEEMSVSASVCEVLRGLHLDERLEILTQSSDHVQNSPLSLLQDILTAGPSHRRTDSQPGEEVIVDCY